MRRSTRSFLFPDVNVWIALTYDGHKHHRIASKWYSALGDDARVFFCRITQLGLLRLLSQVAVMGKEDVMSQAEAWRAFDLLSSDDRVAVLAEPAGLEPEFRRITGQNPMPAPKDWADSYLAAFAQAGGLTLVTFDRGFATRDTPVHILG
jgi:toxin-antitoxin system PIN domain toxin